MAKGLSQILKAKGTITANDLYENGALTPEVSRKVINAIVEKNEFLSLITTDKTSKLQKSFDVWSIASGVLVRVNAGEAPTQAQREKLGVKNVLIENKPVQLYAKITQDTLEDNADNPDFEDEMFTSFAKAFSNDIQNLGLNGEKDDYADKEFKNLNKGWITLAKENDEVAKVEYEANSKVSERLIALVEASGDMPKDAVIILSQSDFIAYQKEIGNKNGGFNVLLNAGANHVLGVPLKVVDYMPAGFYLMTPPKNLILSLGLDMRRTRWYDHDESSLKYKFEVFNDYQIGVAKWCALAQPKG